ncbi:hypothetical protein K2Z83_04660 [Oscillochloris sp. ZM17-4]|uniref:FtsK/SpoIIIE domain-containing protein n=1 Tax=Oscillochloris sp. ZM17-4 TaxID=2866714 RepID=UPI001C729DF9|nr:FtsK/SpoIIIE domain-containing protein [Oscillochloris sp. ZM17-4]MBX0326972.1 hypothetical protein [Oscillochloris sp. ZM17-4]
MRLLKLLFTPIRVVISPLTRWINQYLRSHDSAAGRRRRQAQRYADALLAELARLGFASRVVMKKGKVKRRRMRYVYPLLMTQNELWLPLDQRSLPIGRTTDELRDEQIINSLVDRLNAGVRADYLASGQFCYVVSLGGAAFPDVYSLNSFTMPPDAPILAVPMGIDSAGDQVVGDLMEYKHFLIAGATGGGKTTLYHSIINTFISRNSADTMELWLVDMKRSEFSLYRSLMGKRDQAGIVRHIAVAPESALNLLGQAYKEIEQRNRIFERAGVTSIGALERSTGQKLKRIVLLVDEFAILTTDTTKIGKQSVGSWAKLLMTRIASLGRSAGVTICIGTQMVQSKVIDSMITANFENRIAFSCATWRESNLIIQTSEAVNLPPGRAILRVAGRTSEIQTCYVTPEQVTLEVSRVAEFGPDGGLGDADERQFVRNAKLLLDVACRQLNGDFVRSKLLAMEGIRGQISWDMFDEIARRLERDGILEPARSRFPRKVARAFFGNPNLLDAFYGMLDEPTAARTTPLLGTRSASHGDSMRSGEDAMPSEHQDAENNIIIIDTDAECGAPESPAHANTENDAREPEAATLPPEFEKLFEKLGQEEKKPKKKRKKPGE